MPPETKDVRERKDDGDGEVAATTGSSTDLSHECRRFSSTFHTLSRNFAETRRVEEDWPMARLAHDTFYGYRVISRAEYFRRATLVPTATTLRRKFRRKDIYFLSPLSPSLFFL